MSERLEYIPTAESSANTEPETNGFEISNFIVSTNFPLLYLFRQKNKLVLNSFFIPSGSTNSFLVRASAANAFSKIILFVLQMLSSLFIVFADTVTSMRPTVIGLILNLKVFDFPLQTHRFDLESPTM